MKNNLINVITQGFYGNRTTTEISLNEIDWFMLGWIGDDGIRLGKNVGDGDKIKREVIKIPNTDCVLIYNPIIEEEDKKKSTKPVAIIPDLNLEIYSRCIVCRIDDDGNFESITPSDYEAMKKYLAE